MNSTCLVTSENPDFQDRSTPNDIPLCRCHFFYFENVDINSRYVFNARK
jgi:hypothetical protein